MNGKVELPVVTETETDKQHISLSLIADGLRQAEVNLQEQEDNIKKFSEKVNNLQQMRIATIAQRNLLAELDKKIREMQAM